MEKANLDGTDLKILNLLARNGRISYRSIGLTIGLTTKSVKSRVDRMLAAKVIEKFLVKVNPSVLGYEKTWAFALRKNELNQELIDRINLVGDIQYQFEVMGGVIGFDLAIKEGTEDKVNILFSSLKSTLLGLIQSRCRNVAQELSQTDYAVMKQLVGNPRMEIGDIATATAISPKTVRRRLERLIASHVLEFSIQPNPEAMKGLIVFFLDVKVKSRNFHEKVHQKIYEELNEQFMLSSDMSNQEDSIGLLLGSEDAAGIESIRSRIESSEEVHQADAFLPIKLTCPQGWVIKALDRRLAKIVPNRQSLWKNADS